MTNLWRSADDDSLPTGCAAFAEQREAAEAYLANPGFGGATLWSAEVEFADGELLDIYDAADPVEALCEAAGVSHPGAIGADEWLPRDVELQDALRERGICWVRVRESYPEDAATWLWIGPWENEPELTEVC